MSTTFDEQNATPRLWISNHRRIACDRHLPKIGSAAWWADVWRVMEAFEQRGLASARGQAPECEACAAIALRDRLDEMQRHLDGEAP